MARRSSIEVVSWLEITDRRGEASKLDVERGLDHLQQVVVMRVTFIERCER